MLAKYSALRAQAIAAAAAASKAEAAGAVALAEVLRQEQRAAREEAELAVRGRTYSRGGGAGGIGRRLLRARAGCAGWC